MWILPQGLSFTLFILFHAAFNSFLDFTTAFHNDVYHRQQSFSIQRNQQVLFSTISQSDEEFLVLSAVLGNSKLARGLQRAPVLYEFNQFNKDKEERLSLRAFAQHRNIVRLLLKNEHSRALKLLEKYENSNPGRNYAPFGTVSRKVLDMLPMHQLESSRLDVNFYYKLYDMLAKAEVFKLYGNVTMGELAPPCISDEELENAVGAPFSKLIPSSWPLYLWLGTVLSVWATGMISGQILHINTIGLCFWVPLLFVLDQVWINGILWETFVMQMRPVLKERALYHEAGHFLVAYLLGCPVSRYYLTPLQSLRTGFVDKGSTVFFDKEWTRKRLGNLAPTNEEVNRISVILMAGIAAELLMYGDVQSGSADEKMLASIFNGNDWTPAGSISDDPLSDQSRWALIQAYTLLKANLPGFLSLAKSMEKQKGVAQCILSYEQEAMK